MEEISGGCFYVKICGGGICFIGGTLPVRLGRVPPMSA